MADLPTPQSRKETYLAKAAGATGVTLPDEPQSREEEYLAVIAEGGGGGGGTSDFNQLSNRPKYNGTTMTSSTDIVVDTSLSSASSNPISNAAVYTAVGNVETVLAMLNSGSGATGSN